MKSTIAAIATAPGEGAVGIVRISGREALPIAARLFTRKRGPSGNPLEPWRLTLGIIRHPESGESVDEVLAVFMPGPRSYSGEDTVEFQAHGGRAVLEGILRSVVDAGAIPAAPGEFTRRAFLNGRLDLAQAEAVIDLIRARSDQARREALHQLAGRLSGTLSTLRGTLADTAASIEAILDFGEEEGIEVPVSPEPLETASGVMTALLSRVGEGRALREGLHVVFAGRPNAGKSSIINCLLKEERSIVTPHPGTTRDSVESRLLVEGNVLLLVDTAGLGIGNDPAEEEGIRRSRERLLEADLVVMVMDLSRPYDDNTREILEGTAGRPVLLVGNKSDLDEAPGYDRLLRLAGDRPFLKVSAKTGEGMEALHQALGESARTLLSEREGEETLVTSVRHAEILRRGLASLERAIGALHSGGPLDLVASELRDSISALGEITGETVTEEILDRIFSQFCIGK